MVVGSPMMSGASDEEDDYGPSSAESDQEDDSAMCEDDSAQLAQLAAAGPVGVAAAAAVASTKNRKRPYSFETNPSVRKRQQNRLLRKLRQTIEEYATRVGQQAVVLIATPGKPSTNYKVFGAKPLEDVIQALRGIIMEELEIALAQQAPPPLQDNSTLFELPPLIIDGIPTPLEKMTQAQLRAFIPLMLKYSTGRGKPGWGRESTKPPWWPQDLPWSNVRMDARTEEEKQKTSWTEALKRVVIECYKYHGREDLLPTFSEEDQTPNEKVQPEVATQYETTVLHAITHPDGTVSIVQIDPNNPVITLPDGTTAYVQGMTTNDSQQDDNLAQSSDSNVEGEATQNEVIDFNSVTEATLNSEGQLTLTSGNGQLNVITVPVSAAMYQSMMSNIQCLNTNSEISGVTITPVIQVPKEEQNGVSEMETMSVSASGVITSNSVVTQNSGNDGPQVLQVYSMDDCAVLTKVGTSNGDVKCEEEVVIGYQ